MRGGPAGGKHLTAGRPACYTGRHRWGISSAGRAREWHSRGHGFNPRILHQPENRAPALQGDGALSCTLTALNKPIVIVYVLKGRTGKRYVGITNDLERRLRDHGTGTTKGGQLLGDFWVLHVEQYTNYLSAREREKFLKSGQGRKWLDELERGHGPPEAGKAAP